MRTFVERASCPEPVMRRSAAVLCCLVLVGVPAAGAEVTLVVSDPDGAAGRVGAPASVELDLKELLRGGVTIRRLRLVEVTDPADRNGTAVPVQFEPAFPQSARGRLWWLMPQGQEAKRQFRLTVAPQAAPAVLRAEYDGRHERVDVAEGNRPVLRYNHGTVPPPPEIVARFERGQDHPLHYARGDYIHPLFGPDGEELTDDYSLNHPHHRGVSWSWPVVRWRDEVRDLWAVRVLPEEPGGVWARPVGVPRINAGPVLAAIDAESAWKWGDRDPIVREVVSIRAFRQRDRARFVDVEVRLTALVDEVSIGGRPGAGYGGFALRTFPEFDRRQIAMRIDPPQSEPRRAWFHLTGLFPGGRGLAGVAMFEHVTNPGYPSYPEPEGLNRVPQRYPPWRCVLPSFPGDREVPLRGDRPLVLRHRLWIHPGGDDEQTLADVWSSFAKPPIVNNQR